MLLCKTDIRWSDSHLQCLVSAYYIFFIELTARPYLRRPSHHDKRLDTLPRTHHPQQAAGRAASHTVGLSQSRLWLASMGEGPGDTLWQFTPRRLIYTCIEQFLYRSIHYCILTWSSKSRYGYAAFRWRDSHMGMVGKELESSPVSRVTRPDRDDKYQ